MDRARVFLTNQNQAVRFPKSLHIDAKEMIIDKDGENFILIPQQKSWDLFFDAVDDIPEVQNEFQLIEELNESNTKDLF